jgi:hypothetical protein
MEGKFDMNFVGIVMAGRGKYPALVYRWLRRDGIVNTENAKNLAAAKSPLFGLYRRV